MPCWIDVLYKIGSTTALQPGKHTSLPKSLVIFLLNAQGFVVRYLLLYLYRWYHRLGELCTSVLPAMQQCS